MSTSYLLRFFSIINSSTILFFLFSYNAAAEEFAVSVTIPAPKEAYDQTFNKTLRLKPQPQKPDEDCDQANEIGYIYYDEPADTVKICTKTGWKSLGAGAGGPRLLATMYGTDAQYQAIDNRNPNNPEAGVTVPATQFSTPMAKTLTVKLEQNILPYSSSYTSSGGNKFYNSSSVDLLTSSAGASTFRVDTFFVYRGSCNGQHCLQPLAATGQKLNTAHASTQALNINAFLNKNMAVSQPITLPLGYPIGKCAVRYADTVNYNLNSKDLYDMLSFYYYELNTLNGKIQWYLAWLDSRDSGNWCIKYQGTSNNLTLPYTNNNTSYIGTGCSAIDINDPMNQLKPKTSLDSGQMRFNPMAEKPMYSGFIFPAKDQTKTQYPRTYLTPLECTDSVMVSTMHVFSAGSAYTGISVLEEIFGSANSRSTIRNFTMTVTGVQ